MWGTLALSGRVTCLSVIDFLLAFSFHIPRAGHLNVAFNAVWYTIDAKKYFFDDERRKTCSGERLATDLSSVEGSISGWS